MSLKRYQMIYPDNIFRAQINFKNVASSEDKWAEGSLCRDNKGNFLIINNKQGGEDEYAFSGIFLDTLGLCSDFFDGERKGIFEGDIVKISRFADSSGENTGQPFGEEFMPFGEEMQPPFGETDGEEPDSYERKIYADVPEGCTAEFTITGVVYMSGGMFYVQFFDSNVGYLSAVPLHIYFGYDSLPGFNTAVKVIGNMYDDEELYAQTLGLSEC